MVNKDILMNDFKHSVDLAALATTASVVNGWLPSIAAAFSIAWYCVRFYEYVKSKRTIE